jgi:ABC-2 type transport system permease protein
MAWDRIKAIMLKEFIHAIRDSRTLYIIVAFPVIQLILYGYAISYDIKHIPLAVRDLDRSARSRALISSFRSSDYFDVKQYVEKKAAVQELLDKGQVKAALVIPPDFAARLAAGEQTKVQVICDGSDPSFGRAAAGYSGLIVQSFSNRVTLDTLSRYGLKLTKGFPPYVDRRRVWYNPELKTANFIVPGLISMILVLVPCVITSVSIVREKEKGTIENLYVSPVRPVELMLGKIAPYLLIALVDATLITLVALFWFNVPFRGSVFLLVSMAILFMFGTVGLGLLVSTIANTQEVAQLLAVWISLLPTILLSGFVFPIESMPKILQWLSYVVPNRYFLTILRSVFLKGVGFDVLWPQAVAMLVFGVVVFTVSSRRFVKRTG